MRTPIYTQNYATPSNTHFHMARTWSPVFSLATRKTRYTLSGWFGEPSSSSHRGALSRRICGGKSASAIRFSLISRISVISPCRGMSSGRKLQFRYARHWSLFCLARRWVWLDCLGVGYRVDRLILVGCFESLFIVLCILYDSIYWSYNQLYRIWDLYEDVVIYTDIS
jgi:hypothetical protein